MGEYLELMSGAGVVVYIVVGVFAFIIVAAVVRVMKGTKHKLSEQASPQVSVEKPENEPSTQKQTVSVLGGGQNKAMCFRRVGSINVLDFTTIPKPIGEAYEFETSCPFSGTGYIVKEENGQVVDYDPRKVGFKFMESPQVAWFARHWPVVRDVFAVPVQWWKSSSTWFAVGMMLIVFICSLVVFD